jgi:hypothetical protein
MKEKNLLLRSIGKNSSEDLEIQEALDSSVKLIDNNQAMEEKDSHIGSIDENSSISEPSLQISEITDHTHESKNNSEPLQQNENHQNIKTNDGYWKTKLKKIIIFFATGPALSLKSFLSGIALGNHAETIRSGIEGGALLIEGIGFGGFIRKIRDSKFFQKASNFIEYIFPKPVRNIIAIACSAIAIVTTGGWLPIIGLVITISCKIYSIYSDINTYKIVESRIQEIGLTKKMLVSLAAKNQAIELLKKQNPKIDIQKLVDQFHESISYNDDIAISEENSQKISQTPLLIAIGENAGIFSTSITAGLAMIAIRTIGATSYAEMKIDKINNGLKQQIEKIKTKIPSYQDKFDLANKIDDQIFLIEALNKVAIDRKFLKTMDKNEALNILKDNFNLIKESHLEHTKLSAEPSNWKAFLETEDRALNYGNITHDDSIKREDESVLEFENQLKLKLSAINDKIIQAINKDPIDIDLKITESNDETIHEILREQGFNKSEIKQHQ